MLRIYLISSLYSFRSTPHSSTASSVPWLLTTSVGFPNLALYSGSPSCPQFAPSALSLGHTHAFSHVCFYKYICAFNHLRFFFSSLKALLCVSLTVQDSVLSHRVVWTVVWSWHGSSVVSQTSLLLLSHLYGKCVHIHVQRRLTTSMSTSEQEWKKQRKGCILFLKRMF